MSGYSEQSQRLAREIAEKAASNLRRSGRTVTRDASGRYIVAPRGGGNAVIKRNGRTINITVSNDGSGGTARRSSD